MAAEDREHFQTYREQTRIKHTILTNYLRPYFTIRATGQHRRFLYIDGFAGAGRYQSDDTTELGSPLRALTLFSEFPEDLRSRVHTILIESDPDLHRELDAAVAEHMATISGVQQPDVIPGTFEATVRERLQDPSFTNAPSFLFADPCGVSGLVLDVLARYLASGNGEALLFFNYDGVTRIAGLEFTAGGTLSQLMGSDEAAQALRSGLDVVGTPERETTIVSHYLDALRARIPSLFSTAFRIEYEHRKATSHYLMHLTRNKIGFRLMKEVMWPLGRTSDGVGGLALEQASVSPQPHLFRPEWDEVKDGIIQELAKRGAVPAKHFYIHLSEMRDNKLCRHAYRDALLELEAEGRIEVLNKKGQPVRAESRRRAGQVTLGEARSVRLVSNTPSDP